MRFISMHKSTRSMEAGEPPSPKLMAGLGPLMEEMMKAGIFLGGEGLRPSAQGVRLRFSGGKRTIAQGPLAGSNELVDRYLIVRTRTIDEAIEWATRFASGTTDSEIDVRPLTEPWDLGFMPKPEGAPMRFMILHKSDASAEAGERPSPKRLAAMKKLTEDMAADGVLVATEALQPSSRGVRLLFRGGKRTIVDGPFTESKELVGGFSILEVKSRDEVVDWASRFAELIGEDLEIEIRPLEA